MKKGLMVGFVCLSLILILSLSVVSASLFGDFWYKITGRTGDEPTCTDSDGEDYLVKGTCIDSNGTNVEDRCDSSISVVDYRCTNGFCEYTQVFCPDEYGDNYGCVDAVCVEASEEECIDTDGGAEGFHDYYVKGTCTDIYGVVYEDECSSATTVVDYRCSNSVTCLRTGVSCPEVCEDGVCVEASEEPTCTDSDGGKDYLVKGICTDSTGVYEDRCDSSISAVDYNCINGLCQQTEFSCSPPYADNYVCEDGACVEAPEPICTDTNALDSTIKGICTDMYGVVHVEGCQPSGGIQGYFCRYGLCNGWGTPCAADRTCQDGGCVLIEDIDLSRCVDCESLGKDCWTWSDNCGGALDCGSCSEGYECIVYPPPGTNFQPGVCVSRICTTSDLSGCYGETNCTNVAGYWYDSVCNSQSQQDGTTATVSGGGGGGGSTSTTTPSVSSSEGEENSISVTSSSSNIEGASSDITFNVNSDESTVTGSSGIVAVSNVQISIIEGKAYTTKKDGSKREIKIDPTSAINLVEESTKSKSVGKVKIIEYEDNIVYEIDLTKSVKVIALVPANMPIKAKVDIEKGDIVNIKKPWWSFLAKEI